jgi:uncharacterized protein (TIGR02271 family)
MLGQEQLQHLIGADAYSTEGEKIGRVGQVYVDDQSQQPQWLTVNTGFFGSNESFVPLEAAHVDDGRITVPFDKNHIKDAPNVAADGHISPDEERLLYQYYGLDYRTGAYDGGPADEFVDAAAGAVGHDTSGPTTDDAMTRSEEELRVGTQDQEAGRARLRKYVVTENVTQTVPVRKERAVLEREPITDENADRAVDGPAISEEEHEVVLSEERPVVAKEAVPVERVRLGKEQFTEEHQVNEEVRKEQIEAEGDLDDRR